MSKEVKISVIKFEMVNGKKTYKSFTFKLNPKEMAKFKTEATVKKKVAEYVAKSGVYKPSELQNLKYDMKEFLEEWKKMVPQVEVEELAKLDKSPNNPETRVTPHLISRLAAGEIFVFGSNAMGYHDGGAAKDCPGEVRCHQRSGTWFAGNELRHRFNEWYGSYEKGCG